MPRIETMVDRKAWTKSKTKHAIPAGIGKASIGGLLDKVRKAKGSANTRRTVKALNKALVQYVKAYDKKLKALKKTKNPPKVRHFNTFRTRTLLPLVQATVDTLDAAERRPRLALSLRTDARGAAMALQAVERDDRGDGVDDTGSKQLLEACASLVSGCAELTDLDLKLGVRSSEALRRLRPVLRSGERVARAEDRKTLLAEARSGILDLVPTFLVKAGR